MWIRQFNIMSDGTDLAYQCCSDSQFVLVILESRHFDVIDKIMQTLDMPVVGGGQGWAV